MTTTKVSYGQALLQGFDYLLSQHPEVFVIGQGLWSPWYVGNSMTGLDKKFGKDRVIDTPVSEAAVTGLAVGASLTGKKAIVVHPRMDFLLYAMDPIVNQAAKWNFMFGGAYPAPVTFRAIINRGGEQGAQHSQALHSWFMHVPGLRVVMPYSVSDARDLLISSVLCQDPVMFIDNRWLYETEDMIQSEPDLSSLEEIQPTVLKSGDDITIVGSGHDCFICLEAANKLAEIGISAEVIDLRVLSPLPLEVIFNSVLKTGRVICVDSAWSPCGLGSEVITKVVTNLSPSDLKSSPRKVSLPFAPAPTSVHQEKYYYITADDVCAQAKISLGC